MKRKILIISSILIFTIALFNIVSPFKKSLQTKTIKITGKIKDEKTVTELLNCLETNIGAANNKDIEAYLQTLNPDKREETKKEMSIFFDNYNIETELLSFEVKKQNKDHVLVQAQQKSINHGNNSYRNHITEANHTFIKKEGRWLIDETIMTNTTFIK